MPFHEHERQPRERPRAVVEQAGVEAHHHLAGLALLCRKLAERRLGGHQPEHARGEPALGVAAQPARPVQEVGGVVQRFTRPFHEVRRKGAVRFDHDPEHPVGELPQEPAPQLFEDPPAGKLPGFHQEGQRAGQPLVRDGQHGGRCGAQVDEARETAALAAEIRKHGRVHLDSQPRLYREHRRPDVHRAHRGRGEHLPRRPGHERDAPRGRLRAQGRAREHRQRVDLHVGCKSCLAGEVDCLRKPLRGVLGQAEDDPRADGDSLRLQERGAPQEGVPAPGAPDRPQRGRVGGLQPRLHASNAG